MSNIELSSIEEYNLFHGHTQMETVPKPDELVDYMVELFDIANDNYQVNKPDSYSLNVLKRMAKEFFNETGIKLNNIVVLSDEELKHLMNSIIVHDAQDILDLYNTYPYLKEVNNNSVVSPFDIPIELTNTHGFNAKTINQMLLIDDPRIKKEVYQKLNIFFKKIQLSKNTDDITTASYIHEITHTQLEDQKGIVEDFYNGEVLSIFNELLYAYSVSNGLLNAILTYRINQAFNCFTRLYQQKSQINEYITNKREFPLSFKTHTDYKYVLSTLKAIELLNIYINNSKGQTITNEINDVFQAYQTLEEMLFNLNVNIKESTNIDHIRSLYKRFDK